MGKKRFSKVLAVSVLSLGLSFGSLSSTFAAELGKELPDTSVLGSEEYVAPEFESAGPDSGQSLSATRSTHSYSKKYRNLYGITVATQLAYVQWTWNAGKITTYNALWQNNSTAIGYGFTTETNTWNSKESTSGQANQSVKFESGIPTPWGHVGGPQFTSRLITSITGSGKSSAY